LKILETDLTQFDIILSFIFCSVITCKSCWYLSSDHCCPNKIL